MLSESQADSSDADGDLPYGPYLLTVMFGVVLPVLCLLLDPFVFRNGAGVGPLYGAYRLVGYTASGLGILAFILWNARGRPAGLLAGLLAGGATFAGCVGLLLLPYSLLGLVTLIGVLGFVPFGTAWMFARSARQAWRTARQQPYARVPVVSGYLIACSLPWAIQLGAWRIAERATVAISSDDPVATAWGEHVLTSLWTLVDMDSLVTAYINEQDDVRRRRLADTYHRITGESIDQRHS